MGDEQDVAVVRGDCDGLGKVSKISDDDMCMVNGVASINAHDSIVT